MLCAIGVSLVNILLLPVYPNVYAWFPLRFILGMTGTCMWIAGEAWVNQITEDRSRGRVIGLYSAALGGGMAMGPLILAATGSVGWAPFITAAIIVALSSTPLFLATKFSPDLSGTPSARLPMFILLAPTALLLNLVFAATDGILLTFMPIYTIALGVDESSSLYLLTLLGLGGLIFTYPMGWLADHVDRRFLVICSVVFLIATIAVMPLVIAVPLWNSLYIFLFGGVFGSLYALSVILLGERFKGADLAAASAVFGFMWGIGTIVGPPVGGLGMDLLPPHGMVLVVGLCFLVYLPIPVIDYWRQRRRYA